MGPIKRPSVAGSFHASTADGGGKQRRLSSIPSSDASMFSPVRASRQPSAADQTHIHQLRLQEPASGPLSPINCFSDEFEEWETLRELMTPARTAFSASGQTVPDSDHRLRSSMEDILWSDNYETHEASRVTATLAEYQALLGNADSAAPDPGYSHSQGNSMEDILWSDDYETHEASRVDAILTEYQAILLNADSAGPSVEPDQAGNNSLYAKHVSGSGRRESSKHLSIEERQAILNIFKNDSKRSSTGIANEFGFGRSTIIRLRNQFRKTGNTEPRELSRRLTLEERQAILNIFMNHSERSIESIAGEFSVSPRTIARLRNQFRKTGKMEPRESSRRLTLEERQAILNIFVNHSERSLESIAGDFGVTLKTITRLRKKFRETGNLNHGLSSRRLTSEERQAILSIFTSRPERSSESIAGEFGVTPQAIVRLRKQFRETGNLDRKR